MNPKNFPGRVKRRQYEAAVRKMASDRPRNRHWPREEAACEKALNAGPT